MKLVLCFLFFGVVPVHAATYTVKAASGGNYTTIQACANAMSAGDTCTVYAGTYNESVTVPAGTAGNYKAVTVNPGDTVYVLGFTVNSHAKINGFQIQNPSSPNTSCVSVPGGTTDFYITNNVMYACGGLNEGIVSYGYITGNTLSYAGTTSNAKPLDEGPGFTLAGSYQLIANNDISHVSDAVHMDNQGSHIVFRHNKMHDTSASECKVGGNGENCHIDFIESEPSGATQYNLFEGNTQLNNLGGNGHGYLVQGDACGGQCHNVIIRFNTAAHLGGGGILDDNALNSSSSGFSYIKSYNNTWVDTDNDMGNQLYGISNAFDNNSTHGAESNDLFYYPESLTNYNAYATDSSSSPFVADNNLAYCTGGTCSIHSHVYGGGNWTDDPGNIMADPKFANYANNDFSLASGSPAIAAGTNLTTVAKGDSGSGTSLLVSDASFFQDGSGLAGVIADCISVTTVTSHVCVTSINYSTNTLTLASSITRSVGDRIWLYSISDGTVVLSGAAPNIGAFPVTGASTGLTPAAPTNLTGVVK